MRTDPDVMGEARDRLMRRAVRSDCQKCSGWGYLFVKESELDKETLCWECAGTGLDPMPWTELFKLKWPFP